MGSEIHRLGMACGSGKKEWNLFVVGDKKVVNAMPAPGVFLIRTRVQTHITPRCSTRLNEPPVLLALDAIFYPQPCFDGTGVVTIQRIVT